MADDDKKEPGLTADEALLKESREGLEARIDDERNQRELMRDDMRFAALDQWPNELRNARENDVVNGPRPCLTIDQVNQYITQVSNDMAKNRPSIKTRPVDDVADPETAKIFQGLIRHIEDQSKASVAYNTAGDSACTIGLGFVRVITDYVSDDSFDQEIFIRRVPDTFSVYLGPHIMPDGSDSETAWIFEKVPRETFKRLYPKAKIEDADFSSIPQQSIDHWKTEKTVTVCEYFYKKYEPATLLYLADGRTIDKSEYDDLSEPRAEITGERETQKPSIKWCKHTGLEVLEKQDWSGKYIPVAECVGKEKIVDGKRHLWGLVRPAKDSLRAFNYWISAMVEKMALSPKAPFIGAVGQFATAGDKWDQANVNNYSKLEYDPIDVNGNAVPPPRRQEPMQMEAGMMQVLNIMQNNVKSSLGMYKAAIGEAESQQSGRAILALQRESDTGTMHFGENQAIMITHVGRIIVDLAPKIYDTKRVLRILGEDGKVQTAQIDPSQKEPMREIAEAAGGVKRIYNLNVGKYDVTVTVGPGYTTSRQEASTVMTELAQSAKDPVSAAIMQYGAVKNADFSGSEEITRMLKAMLPPQLQESEPNQPPIPPQVMGQIQGMQQQLGQAQEVMQKMNAHIQELESGAQQAVAKVQSDHDIEMKKLELVKQVEAEQLRLAREKATAELQLKRDIAEEEARLAQMDMGHEHGLDINNQAFKQMMEKMTHIQSTLDKFEVQGASKN